MSETQPMLVPRASVGGRTNDRVRDAYVTVGQPQTQTRQNNGYRLTVDGALQSLLVVKEMSLTRSRNEVSSGRGVRGGDWLRWSLCGGRGLFAA